MSDGADEDVFRSLVEGDATRIEDGYVASLSDEERVEVRRRDCVAGGVDGPQRGAVCVARVRWCPLLARARSRRLPRRHRRQRCSQRRPRRPAPLRAGVARSVPVLRTTSLSPTCRVPRSPTASRSSTTATSARSRCSSSSHRSTTRSVALEAADSWTGDAYVTFERDDRVLHAGLRRERRRRRCPRARAAPTGVGRRIAGRERRGDSRRSDGHLRVLRSGLGERGAELDFAGEIMAVPAGPRRDRRRVHDAGCAAGRSHGASPGRSSANTRSRTCTQPIPRSSRRRNSSTRCEGLLRHVTQRGDSGPPVTDW